MTKPFLTLRAANIARNELWSTGSDGFSLPFRATELAGEVGEACNIIKKMEREHMGVPGSRATKQQLAEELADVVICADLIAMDTGIDLDQAVRDKFNATSEKNGFPIRLAAPSTGADFAALKARVAELESVLGQIVSTCCDFRAAVTERGYNDSTIIERDAMLTAAPKPGEAP